MSWSVTGDQVDVEGDDLAGCNSADVVLVVLVLVTAAEEEVALVIGVGNLDRILNRAGSVCIANGVRNR